ncbi:MAG: hypothetical protein AB1894_22205 [Chloroflexota bacterium]
MSQESPTNNTVSFGKRLRLAFSIFLRALFRLIIIAMVLGLLAVIVIGVPALYRQYVLPVQGDLQQLKETQTHLEDINQQLNQQLNEMNNRLNALEIRGDADKQAIGELTNRLESAPSTQQAQFSGLQSTQTAVTGLLDEINTMLESVNQRLAKMDTHLSEAAATSTVLSFQVNQLENRLESEEAPLAALQRELQLVKAMELLTRSRLFLVENNLGLATDDIQAARDLLTGLQVPDYQTQALAEIITRLDLALGNLPDAPVLAAEDLEVAWQLIRSGLPGETSLIPTSQVTTPQPPTIEVTSAITPTLSAETQTPTSTPTP